MGQRGHLPQNEVAGARLCTRLCTRPCTRHAPDKTCTGGGPCRSCGEHRGGVTSVHVARPPSNEPRPVASEPGPGEDEEHYLQLGCPHRTKSQLQRRLGHLHAGSIHKLANNSPFARSCALLPLRTRKSARLGAGLALPAPEVSTKGLSQAATKTRLVRPHENFAP